MVIKTSITSRDAGVELPWMDLRVMFVYLATDIGNIAKAESS